MTIEQFLSTIVQRVPRKLTAVVLVVWVILDWAARQAEINQLAVLLSVTIIAVTGIISHLITELRHPTPPETEEPKPQ